MKKTILFYTVCLNLLVVGKVQAFPIANCDLLVDNSKVIGRSEYMQFSARGISQEHKEYLTNVKGYNLIMSSSDKTLPVLILGFDYGKTWHEKVDQAILTIFVDREGRLDPLGWKAWATAAIKNGQGDLIAKGKGRKLVVKALATPLGNWTLKNQNKSFQDALEKLPACSEL